MPNFGIDPRAKKMKRVRKEVENQGVFVRAILAYAKRRDVVIFSAAGNDSTDLATPLPAKWASPFNYGSWQIQRLDGWTNGVIVEAYTPNFKRADFSNIDGHISCPGKDVLSAIAISKRSYGMMSGTSMASPYCAAAFAALRSLRSDIPLRKSLECFLDTPEKIEGTPRMDLKAAHEACQNVQ
jgi:subtilisin family serine protease